MSKVDRFRQTRRTLSVFAFTPLNERLIVNAGKLFSTNGQKATAEIMSVENNGAVHL